MKTVTIGKCKIDILPIVHGLVSDADKVKEIYGKYEAYGIPLSIESISAIMRREELFGDYEVSELDLVYAKHLSVFGSVEFPTPAFCELVDLCKKDSMYVIPLDMNEAEFTETYLNNVKATEFVKEHRVAKKGMKHKFKFTNAETFAKEWDTYINGVKGYGKLAECRENYIAEQIADVAKYRQSFLVVIEVERFDGVMKKLEKHL